VVVSYNRAWVGSSTHTIDFGRDGKSKREDVKLDRKGNAKTPWLIFEPSVPGPPPANLQTRQARWGGVVFAPPGAPPEAGALMAAQPARVYARV
jgi:hypothetical protein